MKKSLQKRGLWSLAFLDSHADASGKASRIESCSNTGKASVGSEPSVHGHSRTKVVIATVGAHAIALFHFLLSTTLFFLDSKNLVNNGSEANDHAGVDTGSNLQIPDWTTKGQKVWFVDNHGTGTAIATQFHLHLSHDLPDPISHKSGAVTGAHRVSDGKGLVDAFGPSKQGTSVIVEFTRRRLSNVEGFETEDLESLFKSTPLFDHDTNRFKSRVSKDHLVAEGKSNSLHVGFKGSAIGVSDTETIRRQGQTPQVSLHLQMIQLSWCLSRINGVVQQHGRHRMDVLKVVSSGDRDRMFATHDGMMYDMIRIRVFCAEAF